MQISKIEEFHKGWIIGNFYPSLINTKEFEVGVKFFSQGEIEPSHFQLTATEITVVISGAISLGGEMFEQGDIITISPKEVADFLSVTDSVLVCIKLPSYPNDKVVVK
jgi:hypothetical protein